MASLNEMFEKSQRREVLDHFEHEPVPLDVFVSDPGYLKNPPLSPIQYNAVRYAERIYFPETYTMLAERSSTPEARAYWSAPDMLGRPMRMCNFCVFQWGKGAGKDHVCRVISMRVAYLLLCLRSPQDYFRVPIQDPFHLLNVAASTQQANRAFFGPLRTILNREGNWFRKNDYAHVLQGSVAYAKNIEAISGHSDAETQEGLNLMLGVADEIDAFKTLAEIQAQSGQRPREAVNSAEAIIKMLRTSARTRFPQTFKNVYLSWPRYHGSMIQQLTAQGTRNNAEKKEKSAWYVSGPLCSWDVNPNLRGREDFAEDYDEDPLGSEARYECKPQMAVNPYFADESAVIGAERAVVREPLIPHYVRSGPGWSVTFDFGAELRPVRGAIYAMHCDLAKSGDRAGIAMAHVVRQEEITEIIETPEGRTMERTHRVPHVKVDFVISFEADLGTDPRRIIQISWARKLFVELRNRQFHIPWVSFDGYQSLDTMQILEAQYGVKAELISTDRSEEYWRNLRDLVTDGRVTWPERLNLRRELLRLSKMRNGKVDHLIGGSKDEADALAGAVHGAIMMGGEEDITGSTVFPELDWSYDLPPLAAHLPVGFTDPAILTPDIMVHSIPVSLDGMGRPLTYDEDLENAIINAAPEEYHQP